MRIAEALADQQDELDAILDGLSDRDWTRPSRCAGWTVADVVLHLAQTNELALGSATGRFAEVANDLLGGSTTAQSIDGAADAMVERDRGASARTVRDRWRSSVSSLRTAFDAADAHDRVTWVAGQLSIRTLMTTRLAETWIHTGDVAAAFGELPAPTDRLEHVARLAWRTLPYAFERAGRTMHGAVAFDLTGPTGSPWVFDPDDDALTRITGDGVELCLVAARRVEPGATDLRGDGADAEAVLELVRTYA